jgi:hypothetical protein
LTKEKRKFSKGKLIESNLIEPKDVIFMTRKGGWYDKMIIISFFKDTYTALKEPLRLDIEALIKKKEHCESVWYTLLALYIYQKCLMPYSAQLKFTILFAIAWLK